MDFKKISSTLYFKIVSVTLVSLLTIATIMPTTTFVGEFLAGYAVQTMLFFLVVGFLGFVWRHNTVIFINFMACMMLCSFLKKQESVQQDAPKGNNASILLDTAKPISQEEKGKVPLQRKLKTSNLDFLSLNASTTPQAPNKIWYK